MIILDTNVVSEVLSPKPNARVIEWLAAQDGAEVYLTAITEAELWYGASILPTGHRRDGILNAIDGMLREDFRGRVLPFDSAAAVSYAVIVAERRGSGRPIAQLDCQIAAIGRAHAATVATGNISDFQGCGIDLTNPWSEEASAASDGP